MRKLTVSTFNLSSNSLHFPNRIYELSNILNKNRTDIIFFQEDFQSKEFSSSKFLNIELDFNYISTKVNDNTYLTALSKYDIKLIDTLKSSNTVSQVFSLDYDNKKILLVNINLCSLSSKNREEQLKEILTYVDNSDYDIKALCGSFYASFSFPEIQIIKDKGFMDSNREFTHMDKIIQDYIFIKSKKSIEISSKVLFKGFSKHHCLTKKLRF